MHSNPSSHSTQAAYPPSIYLQASRLLLFLLLQDKTPMTSPAPKFSSRSSTLLQCLWTPLFFLHGALLRDILWPLVVACPSSLLGAKHEGLRRPCVFRMHLHWITCNLPPCTFYFPPSEQSIATMTHHQLHQSTVPLIIEDKVQML